MDKKITIGRLAKLAGVNIQTIHYYERCGILHPVSKTESGYRLYGDEELKRLIFIRYAKEWGFTLKEIGELLELKTTPLSACNKVRRKTEDKLKAVERRIEELKRLRVVLKELITACEKRMPLEGCPILKSIDKGGETK
ncbi:MAG: MerR family DNA-binding protein [Nitrospinota bacterium]